MDKPIRLRRLPCQSVPAGSGGGASTKSGEGRRLRSFLAIVLWLIGSALLSWYLSNFANDSATYGSLGAAIGLMTWMWLSAIAILVGTEFNLEIERRAAVERLTH